MSATASRQITTDPAPVQLVELGNAKRADLDRFLAVTRAPAIRALYEPYRGVWCPYTEDTLRRTLSHDNPIYEHTECRLFVARRDGADVGRVVAFHNPLSSLTVKQRLGCFGFFEAADLAVARALLLDGAWPWLKGAGLEGMVGNVNPTTNDEVGVLVSGFHRHVLLLEFNPPEYPELLESLGLKKALDVYAFHAELKPETFAPIFYGKTSADDFLRVSSLMARRSGVTIEYLDKRNVAAAAREFCTLYNRAWRDHWGFEPFASAELLYLTKDLLMLLPRELLILARDKQGALVGAALCTPDLNRVFREFDGKMGLREQAKAALTLLAPRWLPLRGRPETLRVIALGVLPEHARKGASVALMARVIHHGIKMGYRYANISWVLENNDAMIEVPRRLNLSPDQTWRFFEYRPS